MEAKATIRHKNRTCCIPVLYQTIDDLRRLILRLDPVERIEVEGPDGEMSRYMLSVPAELFAERDGEKGGWRN